MKELTKEQMFLAATGNPADLARAGWTPAALARAGWTPAALARAGWTPADLARAGWTPADLVDAGWTPADLVDAGWTPAALARAGWTPAALARAGSTPADLVDAFGEIPLIEKPYTRMLADIRERRRVHNQSTFGPDADPATNLCKTPMCTAGHLVNMAGAAGYELKRKFGWAGAATLIHDRAHPDAPPQNFGSIPQAWALAYIETMAEREAAADATVQP